MVWFTHVMCGCVVCERKVRVRCVLMPVLCVRRATVWYVCVYFARRVSGPVACGRVVCMRVLQAVCVYACGV